MLKKWMDGLFNFFAMLNETGESFKIHHIPTFLFVLVNVGSMIYLATTGILAITPPASVPYFVNDLILVINALIVVASTRVYYVHRRRHISFVRGMSPVVVMISLSFTALYYARAFALYNVHYVYLFVTLALCFVIVMLFNKDQL